MLVSYPLLIFAKWSYSVLTMSTNTKIFTTLITISFLLIIGIVLRYTQAADVSTSAEIQNTTPTVDTIRFATTAYAADNLTTTGILPSVGTTRTIHINGTINDANGEADIASSTLNLVFHKTTATNTCTADQNDCYRITTCTTDYTQGSDTEIAYNCEVPIQYFIDATDEASIYPEDNWSAYVEVEDFATAQGTLSATIEVNSLLALNLPDGIDYGTRSLGEQSSSTTNTQTTITQRGNTKADVQVSGDTMDCDALGALPVTAQSYALTDVGYTDASAIALSGTPTAAERNIDLRTDESNELSADLYWNIAVPASGVKGACVGSNTIAIVAQAISVAELNNSSWVDTGADLPGVLGGSNIATVGDYVYLFGGKTSTTGFSNAIYRAPVTSPTAWVNTGATLPASIAYSQTRTIGDYVYLFGGRTSNTASTNIIYRAPTSDPTAWLNTGATLPISLSFSQSAIIGDYVYLFGGANGNTYLSNIYRAPLTNPLAWVNTGAVLPGPLSLSQSAIIGDYVYLFGGRTGDSTYTNAIYRAPTSDPTAWVNTGSVIPSNLAYSKLVTVGSYAYLFGGYNGTSYLNAIYRAPLDSPTSWEGAGVTLPTILALTESVTIGNYVYLLGGYNGTSYINTIYRALIE